MNYIQSMWMNEKGAIDLAQIIAIDIFIYVDSQGK
jgi:hypothetical protein